MLGVSSESLAQSLNTVLSGVDVTQIRDGNYLIDVVARSGEEERMTLATLRNLELLLPGDRIVPLIQIGTHRVRAGTPLGLAARPAADTDGSGRRGAGHPARDRGAGTAAEDRRLQREAAGRLSGRGRRIGGRKLQVAALRPRGGSADAASDADHPDVSAAELPAAVSGAERRAARADRRGGGARSARASRSASLRCSASSH